jgi:5-methylthioadenosine/S-adenosylhomocysteine deaminase
MLSTIVIFASLLSADTVIGARYVVTMDARRQLIEDGAVRVRGGEIVAVGQRASVGRPTIQLGDAILMPGLINAHTHAPMSLFRGVADDLPLQEWLEKFIFPAEARNLNPEFIRWGTRLACLEMLLGGVTTFVDMYYFEELIAEETKRAGMRGVLGQTVIRFPVADAKTPAEALARTEKFFEQYRDDPLIVPAVAPHALYTNSDEDLKQARALANRYRRPLVIHLSETLRENRDTIHARQVSPTRVLENLGVLDGWTIAAHAVWMDDADLAIAKRRATGIAHCPSSNMKLASGIAPVLKMFSLGIPVGLGTDGPAGSNNDFSLFEEMDLASKLAKVHSQDSTALPAEKAVAMATIEGAKAIGLADKIGSIEPGKRADLVAVRLDQPHAMPMFKVYSQLVYALKASDVSDVMVEGRWLVRARRPQTLDPRAIRAKAAEYQAAIRRSLIN